MTPESAVKNKIREGLKPYGDLIWAFMPVQMGFGAAALDFVLCVAGRLVAIETKAVRPRTTARQRMTAEAIERAGGLVFLVCGVEEAEKWISEVLPDLVASPYRWQPKTFMQRKLLFSVRDSMVRKRRREPNTSSMPAPVQGI